MLFKRLAVALFYVLFYEFSGFNAVFAEKSLPNSQCVIKGNVSVKTKEKIYHVPGQKYYNATVIRPEYGERWFCSESEARKAGWRKAKI